MMTTMQGEVVQLPVGGTLRRKVSSDARNADMARLHALSEVLGMDQGEVAAVHAELSETAYKAQAAEVLRSGPLTADKKEYLEGLRSQLGLTRQQADKAMASARTEMSGSAAVAEEGGKWTLERVLELAKSGGDVIDTVEEATRRALFRREFEKRVSDGTGDFDAQFVLKELPALLGLEDKRVMSVVKELVGTRRRLLLVQAVSQYRQKRGAEMVTSLLDLLSCSRALPEASGQAWGERAELKDVFTAFCSKDLVPGLGPVSLAGGPFMAEPRTRDRKELYKVFVEHHLEQAGRFTPQLQADTKDLQVRSPAKQVELAAVMGLSEAEIAEAREGLLVGASGPGRVVDDNASFF
ncbi:uncharacterized protein HaLaN_00599, partial [Haematococcus lacustris]